MSDRECLQVIMGDPRKAILAMVVPFFLAAAVVQINSFVDTFWISGLGSAASSAVSTAVPIYGLIMCAGLGIGVAATSTVAYRLGQENKDKASKLAAQSLTLGIILAIAVSVSLFLLYDPIIDIMGAQDVRDESYAYILPYIVLSPILLSESILGGIMRAEGAARRSTIVRVASALFNIILDPIFIYGLGLGIAGAGIATCLASAIALVLGLSWYARGKMIIKLNLSAMVPNKEDSLEVLDVGGPHTAQSMISNLTDMFQRTFIIIAGGTNSVMFYNYAWRYIGLAQLPTEALDSAMVPVCSAANGQGDAAKMLEGYRYVLRIALICAIVLGALMFILADPLISIMTQEDSMYALKDSFVWTLRASVFVLPFVALMGIGISMLQALKRSRISMEFNLIWGFLKLGLYGIACTVSFEAIIYCMVAVHAFGGIMYTFLAHREFRKRFPETPVNESCHNAE